MSLTWVDSHCHLNLIDLTLYQHDMNQLMRMIENQRIAYMLCVGVDFKNTPAVLQLSEKFKSVYASVGIHPSDVAKETFDENLFRHFVSHKKVLAVGETGLDYHGKNVNRVLQQSLFRTHIKWAIELNKPLVVHSRDAFDDTLSILKEMNASKVGGVLHCFTGGFSIAKKAIELGFYIGISGIVTFKNAMELQDVVKKVSLEHILLETDAPWLAPMPYRGKINTPANIPLIGEKVASLKNVAIEEVAAQTKTNFLKLFLR